jgi:hypothetical protein
MKNIFNKAIMFLSVLALSIQSAHSQPDDVRDQVVISQLTLQQIRDKQNDVSSELVMKHNNISLKVGTLKIDTVFIYQGEGAPFQGYLIKLKDYISIESLVKSLDEGCDVISDSLVQECKSQLRDCQLDCDERLVSLIREKDALAFKLKTVESSLQREKRLKYIWSTVSIVAGVGLGIIVYKIAK